MVRLDFTASIDNLTGFFQLTVDIDGLIGSVYDTTQTFPRGANVAHKFSFTFLIYTLDTFITNGGEVLITPSDPMLIWDKSILINRIYGAETIA